jgi:hypothetical protein
MSTYTATADATMSMTTAGAGVQSSQLTFPEAGVCEQNASQATRPESVFQDPLMNTAFRGFYFAFCCGCD